MEAVNEPRIAPAPFDDADADADLVLCSSDNVAFCVSSFYLKAASRIFKDMLAVPQPAPGPANEVIDGKAVVRLTETSIIVDAFLRCICPIPKKALCISQIAAVYSAGDKYMSEAVKSYAVAEVSRYVFQRENCFRAYVLACQFGLREEAKQAAKKCLEIPKEEIMDANFLELDNIPASSLSRLMRYRRACLLSVQRLCGPTHWVNRAVGYELQSLWIIRGQSKNHPQTRCQCLKQEDVIADYLVDYDEFGNCVSFERDVPFQVNYWCLEYLNNMIADIGNDSMPIRKALRATDGFTKAIDLATKCPFCRPRAAKDLVKLAHLIDAAVDKTIAEVRYYQQRRLKC